MAKAFFMKEALGRKRFELNMGKGKISKFLLWLPRILAILFIAFISLFALDVFGTGLGFWGTLLGLFMHLIPSIILLIALVVSWRFEWVGGAGFILFGLWYISNAHGFPFYVYAAIAGPPFLAGILFIISWILKRKG